MQVMLDRHQGANAWLTIGLREGKNREIRRAIAAIGLSVNRLIRISYGPFRLNELKPGEVEELRPKVLRDQLGLVGEASDIPERPVKAGGKPAPKPGAKPKSPAIPRGATLLDAPTSRRPSGKSGAKPGAKPGPRPDAKSADSARPAGKTFGTRAAKAQPAGDSPRPATTRSTSSAKPGTRPAGKPSARPSGKPSGPPTGGPRGPRRG
jgi:23S rRNA pseudouridine2605 synthase